MNAGESWFLLLGMMFGVPVLAVVVPVIALIPIALIVRAILMRRVDRLVAEDRYRVRESMDRGD